MSTEGRPLTADEIVEVIRKLRDGDLDERLLPAHFRQNADPVIREVRQELLRKLLETPPTERR